MSDCHILITRFNLKFSNRPEPSDVWLRKRIDVLRRYTAPTVQSQTAMPDKWLVFCGRMPTWLRDEFQAIRAGTPILRVVSRSEISPEFIAAAVAAEVPSGAERLITTRLDSDDAIARDYLHAVRVAALVSAARNRAIGSAAGRSGVFLNFTHGLQLYRGRLYRISDLSNSFISLIEPAENPKTVLVDGHQQLNRHGPIVQIPKRDMWIQVVHGVNLATTVRGVRTDARRVMPRFADLGMEPSSRRSLILDQAYTSMRTAGRVLRDPRRVRKAWRVWRVR